MSRFAIGLLTSVLLASGVFAAPVKPEKPKAPIELKLVDKQESYKLELYGKTAEEFEKAIKAKPPRPGQRPAFDPKPLTVDFVLEFTNTTKEEQTIHIQGDANIYSFEGEGLLTYTPTSMMMTMDFRMPKAVTLKPGEKHELPVKAFADGTRGVARRLFWTKPGEYKLTVSYALGEPGKTTSITSEPVTIKVVEK